MRSYGLQVTGAEGAWVVMTTNEVSTQALPGSLLPRPRGVQVGSAPLGQAPATG